MVPFSRISHDLHSSGFLGSKDVVGMIYQIFKVDGDQPNLAFDIQAHIRARPKEKSQPADTINKSIQYLYDWFVNWVNKNEISENDL
jgi:hypothetical protein